MGQQAQEDPAAAGDEDRAEDESRADRTGDPYCFGALRCPEQGDGDLR
jgi:hypothetical protein